MIFPIVCYPDYKSKTATLIGLLNVLAQIGFITIMNIENGITTIPCKYGVAQVIKLLMSTQKISLALVEFKSNI